MDETSAVGLGTKVLVAHGSTRALKTAVQELQLAGCDVIATPDGGDAFARFFEDAPAAVICSANLPSLSGINFARMVRSQSPETQVVILAKESIYDVPNGAFVLGEPLHIDELRRILPGLFPHAAGDAVSGDLKTPVFVQAVLRRFARDSDMLKAFDDDGIRDLSDIAQHMSFEDGDRIIAQGEPGDSFYLVVEGQVRVTLAERDDAQVARIGPGGFFGEMAMLSDQPRSASIWSVGRSTLLYFAKEDVSPLLERYPRVREVLSGVALKRTEDNLWSVLFEESEVDQTLADLESSLTQPTTDPDEVEPLAQAPTTARIVERGEELPQNDYSAATAPATPFEDPGLPSTGIGAISQGGFTHEPTTEMRMEELAAYGAESEPAGGEIERRRRHEDVTASFPALSEDTDHEVFHEEELKRRQRLHDSPTLEVAAYRPENDATKSEDISQEARALPRPAKRTKQTLPFLGGAAVGFALGLGAALLWLRTGEERERPVAEARDGGALAAGDDAHVPDPIPGADPTADRIDPAGADVAGEGADADPATETAPQAGEEPPEETPEPSDELDELDDGVETGEDAAALAAGPIPSFSVEERELSATQDEERKVYRKRLFSAVKRKAWPLAIRLGTKLRDEYRLDWEAELQLGESYRMAGENGEALAVYRHFVSTYPTNLYADGARFWLGELYLERGDDERAKRLFNRVATGDSKDFAESAKKRLAELN